MDRRFFAALVEGSREALERILADDFVLIDVMSGGEVPRAQLLDLVASRQLEFTAIDPAEVRVRPYGTTAVITGRTEMAGRFGGVPFVARSRYTHVFVEQEGGWRLVAAQGTQIAPESTIGLLANVDVDDLERAIEFYRRLGLRPGRRLFAGAVAEMLGGSSPIYLLARPAGSPATGDGSASRDYRRHWTPVHLDFVVDDLEGAVGRARAAGARIEGDIQSHPWGRMVTLSDPFGHGVCLLQFVGRGYDEVATGSD